MSRRRVGTDPRLPNLKPRAGKWSALRCKCFTLQESLRYPLKRKADVVPRAGSEKLLQTPDTCNLQLVNLPRRSGTIRVEKVS